jgi:hypothetical protein
LSVFKAGDRVGLIGESDQLEATKKWLAAPDSSSE